jgi:tRNA 2-selenouridine synthase
MIYGVYFMQSLNFNKSLLDSHFLVDVRTPLEFEEDHIPGAANIPLLSNEERVEIGILHKHSGPQAARRRGLELTAPRFPSIVAEIASAADGRPVLVYCWRGGLRSRTVACILELTGYNAVQLKGGYKTYRNHVVSYFENFTPPGPIVVIHGLTGIGKTRFIHGLSGDKYTVIDLEGLACHRGSAFGGLGLSQCFSQKWFETILWDAFRKIPEGRPIILEGESRRIGRMSLPGSMYEAMKDSTKVWCAASLETRVDRLIDEYGREEYREGMALALERISRKLGGPKFREIAEYLDRWELRPFMAELLNSYYDKVYYKTKDWQENATICLEDFETAERELDAFLEQHLAIPN